MCPLTNELQECWPYLEEHFLLYFSLSPMWHFFVFAGLDVNKTQLLNNCEGDSFCRMYFSFLWVVVGKEGACPCGRDKLSGRQDTGSLATVVGVAKLSLFETITSITLFTAALKPSISKVSTSPMFVDFLNRIYHAHYRKFGKKPNEENICPNPTTQNYHLQTLFVLILSLGRAVEGFHSRLYHTVWIM